ncbi:MAG: cobyrinate a,c-diamide synthase, partial [Sporomusaceae bacterium]|nr:cobyrinate a,c-diamide synthase [Sporomusaceae bacterium]
MSKRVMIAGTGSGSGKTTLTCALLAALVAQGKEVISFKCGPDYIDPMFHRKTTGVEARNLDIFLMGEEVVKKSVKDHSANKDIAVLEGVMGLYDGMGSSSFASANHVSLITNTPVVLIVNPKGTALSVCALIKGFLEFEKNNIHAIILNNVSEKMFPFYQEMIEKEFPLKVLGFLPHLPGVHFESRHLGLVTADEIADIQEKINLLREAAVKYIDLAALAEIASQAIPFYLSSGSFTAVKNGSQPVTIYVARDEAFSFFYEDNHDLLRTLGAEIKFFSPLYDTELPPEADGLILWGGYPELYASTLAANAKMKHSLTTAIKGGLPVYAECGGF